MVRQQQSLQIRLPEGYWCYHYEAILSIPVGCVHALPFVWDKSSPISSSGSWQRSRTFVQGTPHVVSFFEAIGALLADGSNTSSEPDDVVSLAQFVTLKLNGFRESSSGTTELLGFLKLLEVLVKYHYSALVQASQDGAGMEKLLIDEYLFTMPPSILSGRSNGLADAGRPLCDTSSLRSKAFDVLTAFTKARGKSMNAEGGHVGSAPFKHLSSLLESAASVRYSDSGWTLQASDFNSLRLCSEIAFSGLKNQGCTCYANSLLQQLFMCKEFRRAVMEAPMLEHHRSTFWHLSNSQLVGRRLSIDYNGRTTQYRVTAYDERTSTHSMCGPLDAQGNPTENATNFKFDKMRRYREEGRIHLCSEDGVSNEPLTKEDQDAFAILINYSELLLI